MTAEVPRGAASASYIKGCGIGDLSLLLQTLHRQQLRFVFVKVFQEVFKAFGHGDLQG